MTELNEVELLNDWIESIKFALLNVFKTYLDIGGGATLFQSIDEGQQFYHVSREIFLDGYFLDLIEVCRVYGGELVMGVEEGRLDREKVLKEIDSIFEEIKIKRSTALQPSLSMP